MRVPLKLKKELNNIEPYTLLQNKMFEIVPDDCYWGASLDIRAEETQFFTRGSKDTATSDVLIGVKFWYVDDFSLYFGSNKLEETLGHSQDIEIALERACENKIRTGIILPKEYTCPTRSSPSLDESLGNWIRDKNIDSTDLANELKCASDIECGDLKIRPITSYELLRRRLYLTNSEGIEVETEQNDFRTICKLERLDERKFQRRIGCSFKNEQDLKQLKRMIKHTEDITPDQHIKKSSDFIELNNNLFELCAASQLDHRQKRVRSTLYTVITPFTGFIHEAIGHPFEEKFYFERQSVDESRYYAAPLYPKTHQKFPEFITFADNPKKRISNLSLFGTKRYDDEGLKTTNKVLISGGQITGQRIGSCFSNGISDGNAYASDLDGLPMPRMSISTLEHNPIGAKDMIELIEIAKEINKNPIIICVDYAGQMEEFGNFRLGCEKNPTSAEAYEYNPKSGEFVPIKNPVVMVGNAYNSLSNCITADKWSLSVDAGFCGVDNPVKYFSAYKPTSQVAPLGILQNVDVVPLTTKEKIIELKTG